jgi:hypothetical protein
MRDFVSLLLIDPAAGISSGSSDCNRINSGRSVTPTEADEASAIAVDFDSLIFFKFDLQDVSLLGARDWKERSRSQLDNSMFQMLKEYYLGLWYTRKMVLDMSLQIEPLVKAPKFAKLS